MGTDDSKPIVFYDGLCALCNNLVKFILKRDAKALFRFCSLQSESARVYLDPHCVDPTLLHSVVLLEDGRVYQRSDAILRILKLLGGPWSGFTVTKILPRALRDVVYDFVARIRYKVFGKYEACPLPPIDMRERFL